ncbi:MAG: DUF934 domain-containing protein [Pseudomonadota bacterium]
MPLIHDEAIAAGAFAEDPIEAGTLLGAEEIGAEEIGAGDGLLIEIDGGADLEALIPAFDRIALISVCFPSFADGRGFSVARRLRRYGFEGRLRASGHVIVDQYAFARECGFDEVAIDDALAARQPIGLWAGAERAACYRSKVARPQKVARAA